MLTRALYNKCRYRYRYPPVEKNPHLFLLHHSHIGLTLSQFVETNFWSMNIPNPLVMLDTDQRLISNKSVLLHHPPLYPPFPKSIPISVTSPTLLCLSLFPLSHPLSLCSLFHWYLFLCHYDPLVSCISFSPPCSCLPMFHASTFCF